VSPDPEFSRFPIDPALFEMDVRILDLEGRGRVDPRRYVDCLLAWSSGERTLHDAGQEYLDRSDFVRAARCAIDLETDEAMTDLRERVERAWSRYRASFSDRVQKLDVGKAGLDTEQVEWSTSTDLEQWLTEARGLLARLPASSGPHLCSEVSSMSLDLPRQLDDALGLGELALSEGEEARRKKQQQLLDSLKQAKRAVDDKMDDLWLRHDAPVEESYALEAIQARAGEHMRRRDISGLVRLSELLERIKAGDSVSVLAELGVEPTPSARPRVPAEVPAPAVTSSRRFMPHDLSSLAKKSLGAEASGRFGKPSVKAEPPPLPALDLLALSALSWDDNALRHQRDLARQILRFYPDAPESDRALGEYLMAEGKLRLVEDKPLQAASFFLDAFRWSASLGHVDSHRDLAASSLLLATLLAYLPADERVARLRRQELTTAVQRQVKASLLPELDRHQVLGEHARVAAQMGARDGALYLGEYIWPYLAAQPRAAHSFMESAITDIAEGLDGSGLIAPLVDLALRTLDRLLPDERFLGERELRQLSALILSAGSLRDPAHRPQLRELMGQLRGLILPLAERHDLAQIAVEILTVQIERLDEAAGVPFTLSHSLMTPAIVLGKQPKVVLQLSLPAGASLLRNIQPDVEILDETGRPLSGAFRTPALLSRLKAKERREISIPLERFDLPRDVKLRVTYRSTSLEGVARVLNASKELFALTTTEAPTSVHVPNPYVVGVPVQTPEQIYGREQQVEEIYRTLAGERQDNVVLVTGERRIGKSTLLNAVEQNANFQRRYLIVKEDLQKLRHERSIAVLFRTRLVGRIRSRLRDIGIEPPTVQDARFEESPGSAFEDFMREVDRTLSSQDRRLLLILDELDQLLENTAIGMEAIAVLRTVILSSTRTSFLFAGATEILRRHTATREDRLFRLAIEIKLKPLEERDARRLVKEPTRERYELTELATDLVLRETNRQPYLLQYVCSILFQQMVERSVTVVTGVDVQEVFTGIVIPRTEVFYDFVAAIGDPEDMLIVKALAALQVGNRWVSTTDLRRELGRLGKPVTDLELSERLRRLTEGAPLVVERRLTTHAYRLQVGLFARHLRFVSGDVGPV
jgi:hypothetical protein